MTAPGIPNQAAALVDQNRLPDRNWYSWFGRIQKALDAGIITADQASAEVAAIDARVAALEAGHTGDELLAAMYGTNGITILGSVDSGVEVRGTLPTSSSQRVIPGQDGEDGLDAWPIPGPKGDKGDPGSAIFIQSSEGDAGEPWPLPTSPINKQVAATLNYANATIPGGNTIASTAAETAFSSSYTIPANDLAVGDVLRLKLWGTYSTDIIAPTITGKVKFGSVVMLNTGALTTIAGVTNAGWTAEASFIVQSIGGAGAIDAQGSAFFATAATTTLSVIVDNTATVAVDTTTTEAITVTITWSASSAANTITLRQMILEKMRA
jgi:hypothetical protein